MKVRLRFLIGRSSPTGTPLRVTMKSSPSSRARMISPLWLRSSLWLSLRVILSTVAPVRRGAPEPALDLARGRQAVCRRRQPLQSEARRQPAGRALEHRYAQSSLDQVAGGECRQGALLGQVGAKQRRGGTDARVLEQRAQQRWRQVDDGGRLADQGQRRGDRLDAA